MHSVPHPQPSPSCTPLNAEQCTFACGTGSCFRLKEAVLKEAVIAFGGVRAGLHDEGAIAVLQAAGVAGRDHSHSSDSGAPGLTLVSTSSEFPLYTFKSGAMGSLHGWNSVSLNVGQHLACQVSPDRPAQPAALLAQACK